MKPIYTIGITGGSGSGKTFFIRSLSSRFEPHEICLISQDDYYRARDTQVEDQRGVKNFDLPEAIDHEHFEKDILQIKRGEILEKAQYTFNNPAAKPKTLVLKPAPILIIEGLFIQYFPSIDKELDLKVFIEAKDHLKLSRRIRRDNEERGYDLDDVLYRYQNHVMPVYETLIEPLKHKADIVIPNNSDFSQALDFMAQALKAKILAAKGL
jgi:uridine kinase